MVYTHNNVFRNSDNLLPESRVKVLLANQWKLRQYIITEGLFWDCLLEREVITNEEKQAVQVVLHIISIDSFCKICYMCEYHL